MSGTARREKSNHHFEQDHWGRKEEKSEIENIAKAEPGRVHTTLGANPSMAKSPYETIAPLAPSSTAQGAG